MGGRSTAVGHGGRGARTEQRAAARHRLPAGASAALTLVGQAVAGAVQQEDGGICQAVHQHQGPEVGLHKPHAAAQQRQPRGCAAALCCWSRWAGLSGLCGAIAFRICCCCGGPVHALAAAGMQRVPPCPAATSGSGGGGGNGRGRRSVVRGLTPSICLPGRAGTPERGSGARQAGSHRAWRAAGLLGWMEGSQLTAVLSMVY